MNSSGSCDLYCFIVMFNSWDQIWITSYWQVSTNLYLDLALGWLQVTEERALVGNCPARGPHVPSSTSTWSRFRLRRPGFSLFCNWSRTRGQLDQTGTFGDLVFSLSIWPLDPGKGCWSRFQLKVRSEHLQREERSRF